MTHKKYKSPFVSFNKLDLEAFINSNHEVPIRITQNGIESDLEDGKILVKAVTSTEAFQELGSALSVAFQQYIKDES